MKKFTINPNGSEPLYIKLCNSICSEILEGRLKSGARLPSKRELASDLGISQNTVLSAYSLLQSRGYIESRLRQGYFVCADVPQNVSSAEIDKEWYTNTSQKYVFSANGNALFGNPAPCTKITHKMLADINKGLFSYTETLGSTDLRTAIASYLYSCKNIRCEVGQIIIGAGFAYILDMCIKALGNSRVFAIENPCYGRAIRGLQENNCNIRLLNSSIKGFGIDELENTGADVLFCMAHHQYPLGYTMTAEYKEQLLNWVYSGDRYIIEFDYDSDFLYSDADAPTLMSLDKYDRIIQIGSFQRSIAPGISLSYAVLPQKIKSAFKSGLPFFNCLSSNIDMALVSELIKHGNLQNNIKMLRKHYSYKHEFVIECLNRLHIRKNLNIFGDTAGSYFCIEYKGGKTLEELRALLNENSIKMLPLTVFCKAQNTNIPEKTFVFGFGEPDEQTIKEGIEKLDNVFI